ncbi:hypothetical protein AcW1_010259 [Taiwanofungus camphoratus]|nr:hypothetical protein AcW1_010259 [Antrodia cinnamomea]
MVYEDAEKLYAEVRKEGEELIEEAFTALLPKSIPLSEPTLKLKKSGTLVAFNTTFFPRRDVVKVPLVGGSASRLRSQVVQVSKDGTSGFALMDCSSGGSLSLCSGLYADCMPTSVFTNGSDHFVLRNSSMQLTISKGRITSLFDVELERELIPAGETGGLVIFDDRPNYWDAWDVEIHHLETPHPLEFSNISVAAEGPLRASIKSEFKYRQSTITITISLDAITASVKNTSRPLFIFDAVVDWHERHEFLKFELPLNIHNDYATYETQFGYVQRPTHKNTTWDMAKFEVCGHKYADLSEFGYGVAILSESKYGFSCRGNVLRISLLRAATAPDAEQDQGLHEFSWAVMPHKGHFLESDVPMAAYLFNSPLHMRYLLEEGAQAPMLKLLRPFSVGGASNVFLETVKRGLHDVFGSSDISSSTTTVVLRLYEAFGGHAQTKLKIASHISVVKAVTTNLLEDEGSELDLLKEEDLSSSIKLSFHGFEVKTLILKIGTSVVTSDVKSSSKRESWVTVD